MRIKYNKILLIFNMALLVYHIAPAQMLKKNIPEKIVVLTFDDASSSHYHIVAPVLKKYGFGATFFVCEFPPDFNDTTKYMTWEQIRELNDMGFEIGNHTGQHVAVTRTGIEQFEQQIRYIEDKCRQYNIPKPVSFAYPVYITRPEAIDWLKQLGYLFARTGGSRIYDPNKDHPYLMPSFSTSGKNTDKVFRAIKQAKRGQIIVFTIHGVPDYAHGKVTTPPELFKRYMEYLYDHHYKVIAMRDLKKYIRVKKGISRISTSF